MHRKPAHGSSAAGAPVIRGGRPILHDDPVGIDTGPVLVLGGRSEIGTAVAVRLAGRGCGTVVLAARRAADLDGQEAELRAAGATTVERVAFDADDLAGHAAVL